MSSPTQRFDVLIAGGGLVGSSLACALATTGLDIALVERVPVEAQQAPHYDERSSALSLASAVSLARLGVWPTLVEAARPIRHIHVSERGKLGVVRLHAADHELAAFGYTLPNRVLGRALQARVQALDNVHLFNPAEVQAPLRRADGVTLRVTAADGEHTVMARLLVVADGAESPLRAALGIPVRRYDYEQTALVFNATPRQDTAGWAYERFTGRGALAVLPLERRVAVVWTVPNDDVPALLAQPPAAFAAAASAAFGHRLGGFMQIGRLARWPLQGLHAERLVDERVVLTGNAAHAVHPIAAQGFNLSLFEAMRLAEVMRQQPGDPGATALVRRYAALTAPRRAAVTRFTHWLPRLFERAPGTLGHLRSLGMLGLDLAPTAKRAFARPAIGLPEHLPA